MTWVAVAFTPIVLALPGLDVLGVPAPHRAGRHPGVRPAYRSAATAGRRGEVRPLDPRLLQHASAARRYVLLAAALAVATAALRARAGRAARRRDRAGLPRWRRSSPILAPVLLGLLAVVAGRAALAWAGETRRAPGGGRGDPSAAHPARRPRAAAVAPATPAAPDRRAGHAGHPRPRRARRLLRPLPAARCWSPRWCPPSSSARILSADWVSGAGHRGHRAADPDLHDPDRAAHRALHPPPVARPGRARPPLPRPGRRAATCWSRSAGRRGQASRLRGAGRGLPPRDHAHAAGRVPVRAGPGAAGHPLGRAGRGRRSGCGWSRVGSTWRTALLVLVLAPEVYLPLRAVGARFHDSAEGLAAASEVFAVLEIAGGPTGGRVPAPDPSAGPRALRGRARSTGAVGPVLDGLRPDRRSRASVLGIRGPSGAGKSTLLDLLLGLRAAGRRTGHRRRRRPGRRRPRRLAAPRRLGAAAPGAVRRHRRRQHPRSASPARPRTTAVAAAAGPPRSTSRWTRRSARTAAGCPPASAAASRSPGPCSPTGRCCCSTSPPRASTPTPRRRCSPRCPGSLAGRTAVLVSHRPEVLAAVRPVSSSSAPRAAGCPAATGSRGPRPDGLGRRCRRARGPPRRPRLRCAAAPPRRRCGGSLRAAARPTRPARAGRAARRAARSGSGVALTATSAWLISTAALQPPVLTLMVAIVAVRAFGLGKGVLRYAERLRLARRRPARRSRRCGSGSGRRWSALGPAATGAAAPRRAARPAGRRRRRPAGPARPGPRCRPPRRPLVGLAAPPSGSGCCCRTPALVARGRARCWPGVVAPAAHRVGCAPHRAARGRRARRRARPARVELLDAAPDLLVVRSAARATAPASRVADRAAGDGCCAAPRLARGLGTGLGVLAIGATSVACTAVGIGALRSGQLPGPALAVLALTPLALADVVAALPDAAVRLLAARARRRSGSPSWRRTPSAVPEPAAAADAVDRPTVAGRPRARRALARRRPRRGPRRGPRPAAGHPARADRAVGIGQVDRGRRAAAHAGPSAGRVLADGRDAARLPGDDVRARASPGAGRGTHLFDSTLRANLLLAAPGRGRRRARRRPAPGPARRLVRRPAGRPRHRGRAARRRRSPAASGSGSAWPARCWPTDRCCSSTNRPRTSTRPPPTRSPPSSSPPPRAARH